MFFEEIQVQDPQPCKSGYPGEKYRGRNLSQSMRRIVSVRTMWKGSLIF